MQLIKKVWSFGSTKEDMVELWKVYCQSVLDQVCVLWHCKPPAHFCVVGCKERGGGLTYGDSLNSSGNDNNAFVRCAGHIWYDTWRHSIQCKKTHTHKNILNLTPSGHRNDQLLLAAHRRCF